MKTDLKSKTEKAPPKSKAAKGKRRSTGKSALSNGKDPLATYEHAPIGIVEASLEGKYLNVNEEFCRIVQYQKEELLGQPLKGLTHEEDYAIDHKLYEQLVAGKIPFYRFEKRYVRKDGGETWTELTRSIVRDPKGKPLYTIGVVLDISERKQVERVLRESVERLRLATEAAQMFTWEWDFQNNSYSLSDNFTQVLGFSTDLLSKNRFDTLDRFIPVEDLQATAEVFKRAVETRKDLHALQCRVINPEKGQTVWLEISAKIVYDYAGQPERMFGVAQNITEDKRKEEALSESEERFRALVSQATAGITQSDMSGALTFVNPRFCEMLGYPESAPLGRTIWELTHTDDLEENKRLFKGMIEQGESYQFEKRLLRKDGSPLWANVSVSPIRDLTGKPKGGVGVIVDIEQRKQAEASLTEYARQQEALYKLSDQLHRTVSLEDLFDAALDAILSALQSDRASILLYDETNVMRFVAWRGLSDHYRKATDGHSPWTPDARDPEPIHMDDVRTAELGEELRAVIQQEGIGALAFIPLISNGKLIGKFMVYFNRPHRFDEGQLDFSLTIAHQLAFGIERKRAEEALRQSEERYRAVVESQAEMLCRFQPDGKILFVNGAYARARGTTARALINRNFWEFISEEDQPGVRAMLNGLRPEAPEVQIENRFQTGDGERWILWTNRGLTFDANGKLLEAQSSGIDITERKQTEKRLALLADVSEILRNVEDPHELMYTISEAIGEQLHVKRVLFNEIDLEHDREIVHRDYHNGLESVAGVHQVSDYSSITSAEVAAGKTVVNNDSKFDPRTAQDYEKIYALSGERSYVVVPMMRENRWVASLWVSDDSPRTWSSEEVSLLETIAERTWTVIEKLRINAELRKSEERYRGIINQTIAGIAETDLTGTFVMVNDRYCQIVGYPREKLLNGMRMQDVTHPDDLSQNIELFGRLAADGAPFEIEKRYVRPDGSPVWVHNSVSAITSADGKPQSAVAVVIDVTERKHTEEQLRESAEFDAFRVALTDALRPLSDPQAILAEALQLVGEKLQVDRVLYSEIENDNETILLIDNYVKEGVSKLLGRATLSDYGKARRLLSAGKNLIIVDSNTSADMDEKDRDSFAALGIRSGLGIPLIKGGRWVATLGVHHSTVRTWTENEIKFVEETADRTWSALERARTQEALRRNEQMFSTLVNAAPFGVYFIDSEFRLLSINKGAEAVFSGIDPLIGRDFAEILRMVWKEPFATEAIERFRHTLRTGESFISSPIVEERANVDQIQAYDWQIHRIILADGTFGVVCYFYDLSEQKKMEATVRASETLYRTMARSIPGGGVYVVDKDFRYLVAEGPVTEAFGLSRAILEGHTVTEVFPDERGKTMEDRLRRNFDGETVSFETEHNGRFYWTQQAPLGDSMGQAIILTIDITERIQAEEALRESREQFSAILRQATAGIVRKDEAGRLIFVNQAFCNMLGYTESELLGKTIWDLMHPDDIAENKISYQRLMNEGIPFKLERRLTRADGSVIWVDASVSPIMDATGKPQSAVTVEVDITGRKQAEEALHQLNLQLEERVLSRTAKLRAVNQALREEISERKRVEEALRQSESTARSNEEKLRTLFDLLPVGISFLDPQGQIIQMNSALPNILKLSKAELLRQTYPSRRYIRADGISMTAAEFASTRALTEGKTIYNVETGIVLEGGEVIWTNVSAAPVAVADVGAVVVTVDITENKRAERALQESHRRLRILSQRLVEVQEDERRALARELHDRVGQTLAALNINLIIINSQLSGEVAEQIGTRLNDSMKLVAETIALVRDVMTDLRPSVLDDYGLEAALESHLAQFVARYNISAKLEKPDQALPRLGPSVEMTLLRIAQEALMNIARHAQATDVRLSLRREVDMICLTIQDNGIGIESWQEANRPGSHGLTIMRERAEAFDGNLQVRSVPGQGTMVEVTIPLKSDGQTVSRERKDL